MRPTDRASGLGDGPPLADFPSLAAFGDALVRAPEPSWLRRVWRAGLLLLSVFVGTAGLALTAATGSPVPPFLRGEAPVVRAQPATVRLSPVRFADPAGGRPWSVRVGSAGDGTRCVTVGQVRGRELGLERRGGRFVPLGPGADAQCGVAPADPAHDVPLVGLRDVHGLTGRRVAATVAFGVAAPGTTDVRALLPNGRVVRAMTAPDGSFVAVLPGEPRQAQPVIEARRGGARTSVSFQRWRVLPDPDPTGRPWALEASNLGPRGRDGRPLGDPDPRCFRIYPVPPFVGWDSRTPGACNVRAGTWAQVTALRTGVRGTLRLGALPVPVDWRGLPTRTLVTVRGPREREVGNGVTVTHDRVALRAAGRTWALRMVGGDGRTPTDPTALYMGWLPGAVRAKSVRVSIRRGTGAWRSARVQDTPVTKARRRQP